MVARQGRLTGHSAAQTIPRTGLVAGYSLMGLAGGTTSVPNLVSGGPALTLVASPTIGAGGVGFVPNQYGYSASTITGLAMASDFSVILAGLFNAAGTVFALGTASSYFEGQYLYCPSGGHVQGYCNHSGGGGNVQSGQLAIPSSSYAALLFTSRGGTLIVRRLDTNAQVTCANTLPVGAVEIDIACWRKNSVYGTFTASYCAVWSQALSDGDVSRAYKQLKRLGACI